MWMWQDTLLQKIVKFGVNLKKKCTLGYHDKGRHFDFVQPSKAATHYGGYSYKVSWSLMKGIQIYFKSPFFCFHGNCGKVCPTDSDFFGLSRSTRCGCCSYLVSSISVWRVTCYDHFCVFFNFFSILAVSMATAAILRKNQPLRAQLHMAYDIPTRFHKIWSRHLREIEQAKMCGRIRIIVKNKHRITIHHPQTVGVM